MIIPNASKSKALFIVDVQPLALTGSTAKHTTDKIVKFINNTNYDAYVVTEFYYSKESMFYRQQDYFFSKDKAGPIDIKIINALKEDSKKTLHIKKTTCSCFKSEEPKKLQNFLNKFKIKEIHFVGFDINECVLASSYDAFDMNYYSFILEELCHHNSGEEKLKDATLTTSRRQFRTNNSLRDKINYTEIDI